MDATRLHGRLLRLARPYGFHFAGLLLLGMLASPLALLVPVPLKLVVDSVLSHQPLPRWLPAGMLGNAPSAAAILAFAVGLLVAVTLLGQLQSLVSTLLRSYVGERLVLDFRAQVIAQIHRVSLSYHDSHGTADSLYRMQEDAPAIQYILADGVVPFVSATVTLTTMLLVTARLDWELALVALAVCPPLFVLSRVYRPRMRRQSRRVKTLESSALGMVQETLGALRIVKAFGQEAREKDRLLQRLREGMRARIRLALVDGGYGMLIGLVTALGVATVLLIGVRHVSGGVLTLGQLLLVLGYLGQLYDPLKTMSRKVSGMQSYLASAERVFALLDEPPGVPERADARRLGRATGAVEFRGVSFAYGPNRPVLHDVGFSVPPGARLGIAGASGAGKTTLISLLTRFYDPTGGQILLDGLDLRDYRLADLRLQFAVVPQEPLLFLTSIGENIAYARPGASHEEIVMAARAANAHEFIIRLPEGYDTQVGERGVQLSGGQRQRIAIARAFLKDSPVLILDEPTSAVDAEAEAAIHGAIRRLMRGRTVILITHRPSMLERCTALVVLENGKVVSDSTRSRPVSAALGARPLAALADRARASNLKNHPAVQAWCRLHPDREPLRIEPLRIGVKNRIYRLEGAGPAGAAVIAKQCRQETARVERTVYEQFLPHLGIPSLCHHGYLEEQASGQAWLFMEEAIGSEYSKLLVEHRSKAARWLGLLHTNAADVRATEQLPDAGPARYLTVLRSAQALLRENLDNPVLSSADVEFLQGISARLEDVAAHWTRLEELCGAGPRTLVHGDFNGKNIRLRSDHGDTALVVFDWENAGWGVPAVDLAQQAVPSGRLSANPDLATYWTTVRERWPEGSADGWRRIAQCGTVFRALSSLTWDAQNLATDWAHAFVGGMQMVVDELEGALERLDWVSAARLPRHEVVAP